MVWQKEDPWQHRYELAKEYLEKHGGTFGKCQGGCQLKVKNFVVTRRPLLPHRLGAACPK